jgi:hypothetical protein
MSYPGNPWPFNFRVGRKKSQTENAARAGLRGELAAGISESALRGNFGCPRVMWLVEGESDFSRCPFFVAKRLKIGMFREKNGPECGTRCTTRRLLRWRYSCLIPSLLPAAARSFPGSRRESWPSASPCLRRRRRSAGAKAFEYSGPSAKKCPLAASGTERKKCHNSGCALLLRLIEFSHPVPVFQNLARLGAVRGAYDAVFLHEIDQTGGPAVADA